MKYRLALYLILLTLSFNAWGQNNRTDDDDKAEKKEAKAAHIKDKTDYNLFHRQMLSLKEYSEERKKIPSLQKANKITVKVVAVVDTSDNGDDDANNKTLTGYIRQDMGDNSINVYEVTFDRKQKKIIAVKPTGDAGDAENETDATEKKPTKKAVHKKNKDDDDDGDDDDTPPTKKQKDDDN
jgi:hypothetical protein